MNYIEKSKELVVEKFNARLDNFANNKSIKKENVFIVWSCKTLQNYKALLSTTESDEMYYELTYNGDKQEWYFDVYKKWENICIKGE